MKKGFTLVELLAVIIILGLLALVLVPVVRNLMNKAEKSTTLISANSYISGVEKVLSQKALEGDKVPPGKYNIIENGNLCLKYETDNITCNKVLDVEVKGNGPEEGYLIIDGIDVGDFYFVLDNNLITKGPNGKIILNDNMSICTLIDGEANEIGSKYQCKVKDNMVDCPEDELDCPGREYENGYYFYVLSHNDDGTTNLIMDSDLGNGEFIKPAEFDENVYGCDGGCSKCWLNDKGPTVAMDYIYKETKDWDNVPNIIINYEDENINPNTLEKGTNGYGGIVTVGTQTNITKKDGTITRTYKNLKARMPMYSEIYGDGKCDIICPNYLTNNLTSSPGYGGYWTLSSSGVDDYSFFGLYGSYEMMCGDDVSVRAVITLKL